MAASRDNLEQFGPYRLLALIASGGMGEVFLARQPTAGGFEREVVVKRMLREVRHDQRFISHFRQEQRLLTLLSHPAIVAALDVGAVGDDPFIAMELVEGTTLVCLLAAGLSRRRQLSIPCVVHLASALASALAHAHSRRDLDGEPLSLIHMDVAPHNVIVTPAGQPKLIDFGIAQSRAFELAAFPGFRGRTAYLAPEQLRGEPLDQRVDLFAFGVVLHEMIVGRPLFRSRSEQQTAARILHASIPPPHRVRDDCPFPLGQIVLRALRRERDRRYARAEELVDDLQDCAAELRLVPRAREIRQELGLLARISRRLTHERMAPTAPLGVPEEAPAGAEDAERGEKKR